jgi:hypothetical protein
MTSSLVFALIQTVQTPDCAEHARPKASAAGALCNLPELNEGARRGYWSREQLEVGWVWVMGVRTAEKSSQRGCYQRWTFWPWLRNTVGMVDRLGGFPDQELPPCETLVDYLGEGARRKSLRDVKLSGQDKVLEVLTAAPCSPRSLVVLATGCVLDIQDPRYHMGEAS